jgi:ABC-2 type transport system permease protein
MQSLSRYARLFWSFGRFSLLNEMAFRANYLLKVVVELMWLGMMLIFYKTIFARTSSVADWTEAQFLFFLGCYYALDGLVETFFLGNCSEFAELVRTGNLDLVLLRPIDEQFLVSVRTVDWSTFPNALMGAGLMLFGLYEQGWAFDALKVATFAVAFACGLAMAYSFLIMLASTSVWMVRNHSLFELWWLFTSLMRYPKEIFRTPWALPIGWFFSFVVPALLVTNVPAGTMVKVLDPGLVAYMVGATVALVWVSRRVFRRAMRSYRSASS